MYPIGKNSSLLYVSVLPQTTKLQVWTPLDLSEEKEYTIKV